MVMQRARLVMPTSSGNLQDGNFGVDWNLWNSKLYGSFDIFKEWRSNILVSRSTVPETILGVPVAQFIW